MTSEKPLFLYGFARSGTTLLTMMMGAHPRIALPISVAGLFYRWADRVQDYNGLETPADIARLVDDFLSHERLKRWNAVLDREAILRDARPGDYPSVVAALHRAFAAHEGKPAWANMDIATIENIERAAHWFPTARFVHLVRDGRDIALSHQSMNFSEGNIFEIAWKWSGAVAAAERIGGLLGPDRHMTVQYEALIDRPEETLSRICDFAGERYAPEMLAYTDTVDARIHPDKRYLWPAIAKPPQRDRMERWRREMPLRRRYVFEDIAEPSLRRLGYPISPQRFSLGGEVSGAFDYLTRGHRLKRVLGKLGWRSESSLEKQWSGRATS